MLRGLWAIVAYNQAMRHELNHLIDELFCLDAELTLVEALLRQHLQRALKLGDVATAQRIESMLTA